jgi:alpha-D-xyloside xylohydrolase
MLRLLVLVLSFLIVMPCLAHDPPGTYIKTEDGVIVYPNEDFSANTRALKIQVVSDNIIRVIACPQKEIKTINSLVVVHNASALPRFDLQQQDADKLVLKTKLLTLTADLMTGTVSFYDAKGQLILNEKKMGRSFQHAVYKGERSYEIGQVFETTADDGLYGLGQHQDGLMNYKGYQVTLFQNNTEVAVPFLVSKKNYGILWDNYSVTQVGDTRQYKPLSAFRLFSKDGQPGWLTASYYNDKGQAGQPAVQRAESEIKYEYLNDSKLYLPAAFKPINGKVVWEGSIASDLDGIHKLRFTYAGYIKAWIDGKLVLDRWRQAWMPGSVIHDMSFEKDKKYSLRIEWLPDGDESYISFKWLEPVEKKMENTFSFSSEAGKNSDYYFIYGNSMDDVIGGYRQLTGKAVIIPKWSLGFWQSRERYRTQDEVLNAVKEFRKRQIPLDNIVLDWSYWKEDAWGSQEFEPGRFPNPDSMIKVLHDKYNTHFMISVWPKFYEGIDTYKWFDENGWLYKRNIADRQRDWIGQGYVSTFYDAFNPGARKAFWDLIDKKLYRKGVDAWWMDASEPDILSNVDPEKRKEQMYPLAAGLTAEYLNAYPLVNAKGIYEGQRSVDSNKRVFILTRSAFAGSQRYSAVTWSGDISATWHDMKLQIAAGTNFSMSGIPYWTMDIGGFATEKRYQKPGEKDLEEWRELMTRWFQFGAFVPLFRSHGQFPFREVYNTAPEDHPAYRSMLYYNRLRYRLMPYIYSLAGRCYHDNYTIMRGLVMDFAKDDKVTDINDQYLFGPSLLINPVYNYKQRSRDLYLPAGQGWYDFYSGKYFEGGHSITADASYERMPLFVKEGSILPAGPALQYTSERPADTITLFVYTGRDATFSIYEDEETNYNYERGAYSTIPVSWNEVNRTLTIGQREGSFTGMLQKRTFRVIWITKGKGKACNAELAADAQVTYKGKMINIKMK